MILDLYMLAARRLEHLLDENPCDVSDEAEEMAHLIILLANYERLYVPSFRDPAREERIAEWRKNGPKGGPLYLDEGPYDEEGPVQANGLIWDSAPPRSPETDPTRLWAGLVRPVEGVCVGVGLGIFVLLYYFFH